MYQTLHLLTKIGLVQDLGFSEGISRYYPDTSLHLNVICTKCGKIRDYHPENTKELWTRIIKDLDVQPNGKRTDIYTYCDDCEKVT